MKKNNSLKKLTLNKETIANVEKLNLNEIKGGLSSPSCAAGAVCIPIFDKSGTDATPDKCAACV